MTVLRSLSITVLLLAVHTAGALEAPAGPDLDARAYLIQDFNSGRILSERNGDERMEPASLTKMLTAYVVFAEIGKGNLSLGDKVTISEKAWRMEGSRMFVEVGTQVDVEALLKGVIIQSGNDASVALAEHVAGTESAFADLMNQYARELGVTASHFTNATGLPHEEHYTTARDLAIIAGALIRDFPEHYPWHAIREYTYNGIRQYNRNRLLQRDDTVDGLKTGHTSSAGYCLVASAKRDGMRLVSVVLGAESDKARSRQAQALLNYGFRFYETHRLYAAYEPLTQVRVWKGAMPTFGVGLESDLWVTVPRGQYEKLNATVQIDATIMAPVRKGEPRGQVRVTLGEEPITERRLIALQSVDEGSLWQQLKDHVRMMFE